MTTQLVQTAAPSNEPQIVDTVVLAFSSDPVVRWFYPEGHQFLTNFPAFVRAFGGRAFENGSAYHVDGFLGAALWLPPDVHPDEDSVVDLIQSTVPEKAQGDLLSILEQLGSFHPREPHWYLPLIGVDPAHQGKGYGSALMEHALIPCDGEKKAAYLESTNAKNIPLYERYGFELVGKLEVGSAPPLFPIVRKPS